MSSFWVEINMYRFLIVCLYMYFRWRAHYQGWDPINWFNTVTFLCLSQSRAGSGFPTSNVMRLIKMRGGCSFCWNLWPSLFKLTFHKELTLICTQFIPGCTFFNQIWLHKICRYAAYMLITATPSRPSFVSGMEMKVFYTAIHIYMVYADSAEKQVVYFIWDI